MREKKFVTGDTPEAKFKSIENTLNRFSRKLGRTISFNIPPSLLNATIELKDGVGKAMWVIPCEGQIASGKAYLYGPTVETGLVSIEFGRPGELSTIMQQPLARGAKEASIPTLQCFEGSVVTLKADVSFVQNSNVAAVPYIVVGMAFYAKAKATIPNPYDIDAVNGAEE